MNARFRPTVATVDLSRLKANYRRLRDVGAKNSFFCPMVKANAYGHGDIEVAKALRSVGAENLGVALIEEGVRLRKNADHGRILVFSVTEDRASNEALLEFDLGPVVGEWGQLETLEKAAIASGRDRVPIHLEFNTGMNRLGFAVSEAPKLREWIGSRARFLVEGICTHLLRGDDAGVVSGESNLQLKAFSQALSAFKGLDFFAHALNSGGTAASFHRKLSFGALGSRPGISTYGIESSHDSSLHVGVKPILSWKSALISVHRIETGEKVSYNATWKATRPSVIGVVPAGYADGYSRSLSNRGSVLCRGKRAPVAGIVCMDYFMVDLTDVVKATGEVHPGEEIVLIGSQGSEEISAVEMAQLRGTIAYETLTGIGERVPRVYVESEAK